MKLKTYEIKEEEYVDGKKIATKLSIIIATSSTEAMQNHRERQARCVIVKTTCKPINEDEIDIEKSA